MASNDITSIKHSSGSSSGGSSSSSSSGGGGGGVDFSSWPALSLLDLSDNRISRCQNLYFYTSRCQNL